MLGDSLLLFIIDHHGFAGHHVFDVQAGAGVIDFRGEHLADAAFSLGVHAAVFVGHRQIDQRVERSIGALDALLIKMQCFVFLAHEIEQVSELEAGFWIIRIGCEGCFIGIDGGPLVSLGFGFLGGFDVFRSGLRVADIVTVQQCAG